MPGRPNKWKCEGVVCLSELSAAQENLQQKEDLLTRLNNLDTKKTSLDELTFELEKRNARLAELEKRLDAQKKIVQDLKNKSSRSTAWI